ncbi:MAG: flagellar motor switch protein FliN [Candidatus Marinimicrobia bacterium]|nr:flagellar motor switch protein FliN [Candidatus Neomarinimicrobiota bacterium]
MPEELGGIFASTMIGEDPNPEFQEDQIEPLNELMSQMLSPYLSELSSIQSQPVETNAIDVALLDGTTPEWSDEVQLVTISVVINDDETFSMYKVIPSNLNAFLESAEAEPDEETAGSEVDVDDSEMFEVDTAQFQSLNDLASGDGGGANINMLMDIEMPITIELGRTKLSIKEILTLGQGSIIELDKLSGDPVDVFINEKRFARGEVVVVDENFGVRITEIVSPTEKIRSLQ